MDQNAKKIGLINWVVLLAATVGLQLVSTFVSSAAGTLGTAIAGLGFLVAILSYFQMRLEEREQLERLEVEELSRSRGSNSLFETADADTFPAKHSREQFERYFVPAFTVILFLLEAGAVYWMWKHLGKIEPLKTERATLGMAFLGLFALVLFLLGKYSSGLARLQNQRLLRAGANYGLLSAYACFLIVASIGAVLAGFPRVDALVGRGLCLVLGLIAAETLLGLIMEIYRVRVKGREVRVLYESRLVGLLGKPEAILSTAAHALDYQFGFKVSETWFYRFLEHAFPALIGAQLGILLISSCLVFIDPGEQGLFERFGAPVAGREVLDPGLHFKLPWPIEKVYRYRTEQVQSFVVGSAGAEEHEPKTVAWTVAHTEKEDDLVVPSRERVSLGTTNSPSEKTSPPVNLLAVGIPVQYQITNLVAWAYNNEDPEELLKKLAMREVVHYLASADMDELMAHGRETAGGVLHERIQASANKHQLGAKILFTAVEDIHPPVKVAKFYEQVIGAVQAKEAKILDAQAFSVRTNALARGLAFKKEQEAEADRARRLTNAMAQVVLFAKQNEAYAAAPGIYAHRAYLQTVARASAGSRKFVIATTNTSDVIQLNLEDKIRLDLEDAVRQALPNKTK